MSVPPQSGLVKRIKLTVKGNPMTLTVFGIYKDLVDQLNQLGVGNCLIEVSGNPNVVIKGQEELNLLFRSRCQLFQGRLIPSVNTSDNYKPLLSKTIQGRLGQFFIPFFREDLMGNIRTRLMPEMDKLKPLMLYNQLMSAAKGEKGTFKPNPSLKIRDSPKDVPQNDYPFGKYDYQKKSSENPKSPSNEELFANFSDDKPERQFSFGDDSNNKDNMFGNMDSGDVNEFNLLKYSFEHSIENPIMIPENSSNVLKKCFKFRNTGQEILEDLIFKPSNAQSQGCFKEQKVHFKDFEEKQLGFYFVIKPENGKKFTYKGAFYNMDGKPASDEFEFNFESQGGDNSFSLFSSGSEKGPTNEDIFRNFDTSPEEVKDLREIKPERSPFDIQNSPNPEPNRPSGRISGKQLKYQEKKEPERPHREIRNSPNPEPGRPNARMTLKQVKPEDIQKLRKQLSTLKIDLRSVSD
ncbi:MAG: hypothetical protein MJ252_30420, partial [archaeon]|nr:hypothetical protein [archaeon]